MSEYAAVAQRGGAARSLPTSQDREYKGGIYV
jgi:hypothetical protein